MEEKQRLAEDAAAAEAELAAEKKLKRNPSTAQNAASTTPDPTTKRGAVPKSLPKGLPGSPAKPEESAADGPHTAHRCAPELNSPAWSSIHPPGPQFTRP
eukprot:903086-Prorocentrum_minimum.AAC.1